MEAEFNERYLKKLLLPLSKWKKLAFSLSICERLYPNFVVFSEISGHDGKKFLKSCLKMA